MALRYGKLVIGKLGGYNCLKMIDSNLVGKLSLRVPLAYGETIGQILAQCGGENFLFLHVNSQSLLLKGRGYEEIDDKRAEEILRQFLKSPEAGKWAKSLEEKTCLS